MRRSITVILCAALAAALTTGTAAARAVDPATALAKQLKSGHGVHFTTVSGFDVGLKIRSYGDLQFGRSRVAASHTINIVENQLADLTNVGLGDLGFDFAKLNEPSETISIGKTMYTTGGITDLLMPEGKKWLQSPNVLGPSPDFAGLSVDVLAPTQLRKLLKTSTGTTSGGMVDGVPTTIYHGRSHLEIAVVNKITLDVAWKVWVGSDGLIRRVTSGERLVLYPKDGDPFQLKFWTDTRLTGWGDKVWIYPPDPRLTITVDDFIAPEVPSFINLGD